MISITVITCTYNASAVIERTLRSVLRQTYLHVEHLIIDGQSKDDTAEKIERYIGESHAAETGHVVRFISEPDKGLYDAMNKGLRLAQNDYLVYLNAGDTFPGERTLETVAASVGEDERMPGVLYGETDIVDDEGVFIRHRRLSPPRNLTWEDFRHGMLVCHQAFYALTSIARTIPYNIEYRYSADVDWCIRVMKQSAQEHRPLRNINAVVVNYLEGGMSIQHHRASLKERFRVMKSHYGLFPTVMQHLWFAIRAVVKR